MSDTFHCGDNSALVSYLYDECDASERQAIAAHVALCAACAAELAALDATREQLASWTPPEARLGFQIVERQEARLESAAASSRPPNVWTWLRQPLPAWAQAAAAVLIFAAGVSLGVARGVPPETSDTGAVAADVGAGVVSPADLSSLEERLRAELSEIRTAAAAAPAATRDTSSEGQMLARVRGLLDESEQRQQRELALRVSQALRDIEAQRRVDLAQIQRTFGQMEGLAGVQVREQQDMLKYLLRVSQQPR